MLKNLFETQKKYLDYFFEKVDLEKAQEILNQFINCKGNIIFSGVGKSGHIAKKLATTMLSTGSRAFYLSPMDALHGDMGMLTKDDIFVALSKSGETKELIDILPFVREKKAKIVSIVSYEKSKLANMADLYIHLPVENEICPFNLAPTTSAAIQLLFGDILIVALMKNKNFTLKEYGQNHPSGSIGKKITLKVRDLMIEDIPICYEDDRLVEVIDILSKKRCGALIVVDKDLSLIGIFTDGDLRRSIEKDPNFLNAKMKDLMTKHPMYTSEATLAWDAMKKMEKDKKITVLPVVKEEKVIGIIRMHDIIQEGIKE